MVLDRLQKVLSRAGVSSRREAEVLIRQGRVTIDGKTVATPGSKVDVFSQEIRVDGEIIKTSERKVYLLLNKPRSYMSTLKDPEGRPLVTDLVDSIRQRVFPVGRLDYDTEGLLLLTNDGDLAYTLTHPSKKVEKIYLVKVKGVPPPESVKKMEKGLYLRDGKTLPARIILHKKTKQNMWFKVILIEGKNRQIKRMFTAIGHPVLKIERTGFSFLRLEGLKPGGHRNLTAKEVKRLKELHEKKG
ncbi:MAG: pseudouridine synthase [Thermodesulfobacteriota bacterium]